MPEHALNHPFARIVNPPLARLLRQLEMDKRFVRGEGCELIDADGEHYLDAVAAYGALPFGHNPAAIWTALRDVQQRQEPVFVQPSYLDAAGELAARLIELAPPGLARVTFANSGTEAVEAAIKLARAATDRMGIIACHNSFHGKTLGALSATNRSAYQEPFGAPAPDFYAIPYGDIAALEAVLKTHKDRLAAFLVEPIQGEGGIVEPPAGYLTAAKIVCESYGVLLMLDEVQTGLGRTGDLFACNAEQVTPDVLILAKALGGGLVPIGAVLSTEAAYTERFGMLHSSTFAGGTLACRAGLATLDLLSANNFALVQQVADNGLRLKRALQTIQARYPHVIREVRGRGYLLGVDIGVERGTYGRMSFVEVMAEQGVLTPLLSSYLLNMAGVRVAPTLNGASVIRVEPPLVATDSDCDLIVAAFEQLMEPMDRGDLSQLVSPLVGLHPARPALPKATPWRRPKPSNDHSEGRFAFVVQPVTLLNYSDLDASLSVFDEHELELVADRWNETAEPFVISSARIHADDGATAYGEFIGVPRTAQDLVGLSRADAIGLVRSAVELAAERGARVVGLGSFTSVVTGGGLLLARDSKVALTTGNSYTVVAAIQAVERGAIRLGIDLASSTIAVVGASGSIGRAASLILSARCGRLILVGNGAHPEQSLRRLGTVAEDIRKERGDGVPLELSCDIRKSVRAADVVVVATSATNSIVQAEDLKFGALVADVSRPPNVPSSIRDLRPDVLVIDGGIVEVPGKPDFGFEFGFPAGLAYACMAETMMLGLARRYEHMSLGSDLGWHSLALVHGLATRFGFQLADLRSFDRPVADADWRRVIAARSEGMPARQMIRHTEPVLLA